MGSEETAFVAVALLLGVPKEEALVAVGAAAPEVRKQLALVSGDRPARAAALANCVARVVRDATMLEIPLP